MITPPNLKALYEPNSAPGDGSGQPPKPPIFRRLGPDWAFYLVIGVIVAVLAMIKVPGFIEAQTRSKISRAQSDLRALTMALAQYRSDGGSSTATLHSLTTPTAYVGFLPSDPWADMRPSTYRYYTDGSRFIVGSFGPDADEATGGDLPWSDAEAMNALLADQTRLLPYTYNPTNGTFSEGDIWRIGTAPDEPKASETKP